MTTFADQLFDDLMHEHGAALQSRPGPEAVPSRHRGTRPIWVTTGLATTAAAITGGLVLFGGAATPAYAVTQNPNGTISVSVSQASAIGAANAKIKKLGVRAVVVPVGAGCPSLDSLVVHNQRGGPVSVSARVQDGHVSSVSVSAKGIPAGQILVLAFDGSSGGMVGASGVVAGAAPSCVSLGGPPPPGSVTSSRLQSGNDSAGPTTTH